MLPPPVTVSRPLVESPKMFYVRLKQLYDDNLLSQDDGAIDEDKELSPTLHNTIFLHWLNILHQKLHGSLRVTN